MRFAGGLGAVVADGLDGAAFLGLVAALFLVGRGRLFIDEGIAAVLVAPEIVRSRLAAQVAVNALVVHVEFAGDILGVFVCSVSHSFNKKVRGIRWPDGGALASRIWRARQF